MLLKPISHIKPYTLIVETSTPHSHQRVSLLHRKLTEMSPLKCAKLTSIEHFTPKQNNILSSQHSMKPYPKLSVYSIKKQILKDTKNGIILLLLDHDGLKLEYNNTNYKKSKNLWKLN